MDGADCRDKHRRCIHSDDACHSVKASVVTLRSEMALRYKVALPCGRTGAWAVQMRALRGKLGMERRASRTPCRLPTCVQRWCVNGSMKAVTGCSFDLGRPFAP
jgi:hypothetical protein